MKKRGMSWRLMDKVFDFGVGGRRKKRDEFYRQGKLVGGDTERRG